MTSIKQKKKSPAQSRGIHTNNDAQRPGKLKTSTSTRRNGTKPPASSSGAAASDKNSTQRSSRMRTASPDAVGASGNRTAIEKCVQNELRRYFDMLDGEEPANLYRMVMRQAECALISMVMEECRGNQTRASEWLGISRGNLRTKLASMDK
ncbi:MAG: helix-turn-helix domain-containing protein [Granulosicoccus sp.]